MCDKDEASKSSVTLSRTLSVLTVYAGGIEPFTLEFFEEELDMDPMDPYILQSIQKMYRSHVSASLPLLVYIHALSHFTSRPFLLCYAYS